MAVMKELGLSEMELDAFTYTLVFFFEGASISTAT